MTLAESIDTVTRILGRACTPETRRMYEIHLTALCEVRDGLPYNEQRYHHANDRYAYREARERGYWEKRIEG